MINELLQWINNPDIKILGIDEAGRGPAAGPIVVAGVIFNNNFHSHDMFCMIQDSKKLSESNREMLYEVIVQNSLHYIKSISHNKIDELGISKCIQEAIFDIILKIGDKANHFIFDGNWKPIDHDSLHTLVDADAIVKEVSAASILAKVTRDRFMKKCAVHYPQYHFEKHKGYVTKEHITAIKQFGKCDIHRKTFKIKGID